MANLYGNLKYGNIILLIHKIYSPFQFHKKRVYICGRIIVGLKVKKILMTLNIII
jgi:hypothetical protein